jgi:argininosuccinate lyase
MTSLSHAWNLKKDCDRLDDILKLINVMPLGSGALAGNPFNIDRISLAKALGFDSVTKNSMHAVGDRDFIGTQKISQPRILPTIEFQRNFCFGRLWWEYT